MTKHRYISHTFRRPIPRNSVVLANYSLTTVEIEQCRSDDVPVVLVKRRLLLTYQQVGLNL